MTSDIDIESLDDQTALCLTQALESVLDARTHKHNHLGQEIVVKGSLSKALNLPEIIKHLSSSQNKRLQAKDRLDEVWSSLSSNTCQRALEVAGLYQPQGLDWDDPRSNRYPNFEED